MNNREKVRRPRLGLGYCYCDLSMVGHGNKCVICGRLNGRKRNKKDTNG